MRIKYIIVIVSLKGVNLILVLVLVMLKGSFSMFLKNIEVSCVFKSSMKKIIIVGVNR